MSLDELIDYFMIFLSKKNQVDTLILRSNIGANVQDAKTASFLWLLAVINEYYNTQILHFRVGLAYISKSLHLSVYGTW